MLGALLLLPSAWPIAAPIIVPDVFYEASNKTIYKAAHQLWQDGRPVDILTVSQRLRNDGQLDAVGGAFYVSQLASKVSSTVNLEYHCRVLIERLIARRLQEVGLRLSTAAPATTDALDLLDKVSSTVTDLYQYTASSHMMTAAQDLDALTDERPPEFLTFGVDDLDRMVIMEPGLPVVVAGRPGMGKSMFCVHAVWHNTLRGNVMLFSPEMTLRQVQARIVSSLCGVPYSAILRRSLTGIERDLVARTANDNAERLARVIVDPTSGITPTQMRARLERALKMYGPVMFAVDHLHKMTTGDRKVDAVDTARVSQAMEGVTEIAKNTGLPALVMAQLNRGVETRNDKRPTLADLKQSGKVEEDAAAVVFLYRDGYYNGNPPDDRLEMIVAKNRDGGLGTATSGVSVAVNRIGGVAPPPAQKSEDAVADDPPF